MKNVNQRRKYSKIKWKKTEGTQIIGTALHNASKKMLEEEGVTIECGGEIDFVKMDRDEIRNKVIARNRRKLDQLVEKLKISEMGFVERVERDYQKSLKSPCGSQKDSV